MKFCIICLWKTRIDQIQDLEQKATQLIKDGRDRSAITEYESSEIY